MKKYSLPLVFAVVLLFTSAIPAKDFEGTLVYSITYIEVPEEVKGYESMLPKELSMHIKGNKLRIEQKVMGGLQTIIVDQDAMTTDILMDMMGQKINVYMTSEEMIKAAEESKPPKINYMEGEKKILGFKCQQAELIIDEDTKNTVWYSKQIKIKHKDFQYLDGFPLEYTSATGDMVLKMTATEVDNKDLSDDMFSVPSGYDRMTLDELTKMMGN